MIDNGQNVKFINFFVGKSLDKSYSKTGHDPGDIDYWEDNLDLFGTYDGYKFLFSETSVGVESNWVESDNISPDVNWQKLSKFGFETFIDFFAGKTVKAIKSFVGSLSDFFDCFGNPVSLTFGKSKGYIKFQVDGDVYLRTIYIRDDDNRIEGYAYYEWGYVEQAELTTHAKIKYPASTRPGGTYKYKRRTFDYPDKTISTPGFYGSDELCETIIRYYNNTRGYFTYSERLDVNGLVVDLIPDK